MELYDYPFGKTENYKMNKDLPLGTDTAAERAKEFLEKYMTISYKDIAKDTNLVLDNATTLADQDGLLNIMVDGYRFDDDAKEAVEKINDRYINSKLSTEATFITDPSLVYEDVYIRCRGVIELQEYIEGAEGRLRCIPVEVSMKQDEDGFVITGVDLIEGYPEFEGGEYAE